MAVPKLELLLGTQSMEGAWLQGSGWQGSLPREGQLSTLQGSPCPASPPSTVGQGTGSWALSQSSSWFMSPLKGAGLAAARDMQRSPTAWHRGASPTWHGQERESDRTL